MVIDWFYSCNQVQQSTFSQVTILLSECKMPKQKKTHQECQEALCAFCLRPKARILNQAEKETLQKQYFMDFFMFADLLPTGICATCHQRVQSLGGAAPRVFPPPLDYKLMVSDLHSLPLPTRSAPTCSCELCRVCSQTGPKR